MKRTRESNKWVVIYIIFVWSRIYKQLITRDWQEDKLSLFEIQIACPSTDMCGCRKHLSITETITVSKYQYLNVSLFLSSMLETINLTYLNSLTLFFLYNFICSFAFFVIYHIEGKCIFYLSRPLRQLFSRI